MDIINNILETIKIDKTATILLIGIMLLILTIIALIIANYYQYHYHEYGHILKIIENSIKDADKYKTETNTNVINIQVAKSKGILIPTKIKTYSNYLEYLEHKNQDIEYQEIIKDIAVSGCSFSMNNIWSMKFHKPYITVLINITTLISLIVILLDIKQLLLVYFTITIILYIFCIPAYAICAKSGYGCKKLKSKKLKSKNKKDMSDHQIFENPSKFKYTNLTKDKEWLQKQYKILLDIKVDLNNKRYPVIVIPKDKLYRKIIQEFLISSKTELTFLFFLKNDNEN